MGEGKNEGPPSLVSKIVIEESDDVELKNDDLYSDKGLSAMLDSLYN